MNRIQLSELTMVETPFLKQLESLGWKTDESRCHFRCDIREYTAP